MQELDFCDDCYTALCDLIQAWIDEPKELPFVDVPAVQEVATESQEVAKKIKAKGEATKPKKIIDWDKACALKLAGWSNMKIADEIGATVGTVGATIYRKLDEYNARKKAEDEASKRAVIESL